MGVHKIWATRKNGITDSLILFCVNWKWKGLATVSGYLRSFTAACMGGKLAFSGFPPLWEEENWQLQLYRRLYGRQTRIFQSSSTVRGGKLEIAALPPLQSAVKLIFQVSSALKGGKLAVAGLPLLSSPVKWIFQFSSAVRGGKLEIAVTLRVHLAEIYQSDFLSVFPFLCFLVGHGSRRSSTKWRMDMYVRKAIRWNNMKSQ